jgi:hypothetical protein
MVVGLRFDGELAILYNLVALVGWSLQKLIDTNLRFGSIDFYRTVLSDENNGTEHGGLVPSFRGRYAVQVVRVS